MGQSHLLVNLDKREFLDPAALGDGTTLVEQVSSTVSAPAALWLLLAASNAGGPRGAGDVATDATDDSGRAVLGRWAGDRIAVVGSYATGDDLPERFDATTLYERCHDPAGAAAHWTQRSSEAATTRAADQFAARAADISTGTAYTDITALVAPVLAAARQH